LLLLGEDSVG
jgi:hypothetical protein